MREALKTDLPFWSATRFPKTWRCTASGWARCRCAALMRKTRRQRQRRVKNADPPQLLLPADVRQQIVETLLGDAELGELWRNELAEMRVRIKQMREQLAAGGAGGSSLDHRRIRDQRGMFSYTGLNEAQLQTLRQRYAIYLVSPGRMCPGLNPAISTT